MKTKIVYTLISSKNDIYLEQMWLSIYSLRIYNPTSFIMVLVDKNTYSYLTEKTSLIPLINQIKIIDVPNNYSAKEKSRYLKTSVRQNVSGPCLFLDTDTIITSSLTELDDLKVDIACVPDLHTTFNEFPGKDGIIHLVKKIFDIDISDAPYYFNSGTIFTSDTPLAQHFYKVWQKNWEYSALHKRIPNDQPSMIKTDKELGYLIKNLNGEYNCQILGSIQYLYKAKIIHFFNATWLPDNYYNPFFTKEPYLELKKKNQIDESLDSLIRNCKSSFSSPTMIVNKKYMNFILSPEGRLLFSIHTKKGVFYKFIRLVLKIIQKCIQYTRK